MQTDNSGFVVGGNQSEFPSFFNLFFKNGGENLFA